MLSEAHSLIVRAVHADNLHQYVEATQHYKRALEAFAHALKFEKNPNTKMIIKARMEEYLARAEQIQEGGREKSTAFATATVPLVKWSDIAGLDDAKQALKEAVVLPIKHPSLYKSHEPWHAILLYGPPGTGKTELAKAIATAGNIKFFNISSSDLVTKWQGESETMIRKLFDDARAAAPAIIFIDEIDSLGRERTDNEDDSTRRIKTQLLIQMNDISTIFVLGATNTPWSLDSGLRRRFERRIYIPMPDVHAREELICTRLGSVIHALSQSDIKSLCKMTEGLSGADISVMLKKAQMQPLRMIQRAEFFSFDNGKYTPLDGPQCEHCPIKLHTDTWTSATCDVCGTLRSTIDNLPDGSEFELPPLVLTCFEKMTGSVDPKSLMLYEAWTREFGENG